MASDTAGRAEQALRAVTRGDENGFATLAPMVYDELRGLARHYRRGRGPDAILQTTAIVHEAYVRLLGNRERAWESRAHFFAVAAKAMRQVLLNHARALRAQKRGAGAQRVDLSAVAIESSPGIDLLDLDEALRRLGELDERQAAIVEMRVLGGMAIREIALVLDVSESTVEREWRAARAWLTTELRGKG